MLGQHTFPHKINPEFNTVGENPYQDPETIQVFSARAKSNEEFDVLMEEQQERITWRANTLNELANKLRDTYDEFIRLGRRKLAV